MIRATVYQWNDYVTVTCVFQYTLSDKCYVLLVSDVLKRSQKGKYLEGDKEASLRFTGLPFGMYAVLVYGLGRNEAFSSPKHHPDYVTVIRVTASHHISETSTLATTSKPSILIGSLM